MGIQTNAKACFSDNPTGDGETLNNLAPVLLGPSAVRPSGEVVSCGDARFEVSSAGKTVEARRAVSCLIEPESGDLVALLATAEGVFITDVLHRPEDEGSALNINLSRADGTPQDVVLSAASLRIEARDKFEASGKELGFQFKSILLTGSQVALVGKRLMTSMQEIVSQAGKMLASFDMTSTRARNRVDRIAETDQLRAGAIQTQADTVALTQSGSSLVVAQEDVRLDGKRITMG